MKGLTIVLLLLGIGACGKGGLSSDQAVVPAESNNFTVFADASDPRILRADTSDGAVHYFGIRDESGLPTQIQSVTVEDEEGLERTDLDDEGYPVRMYASNGSSFSLEWDKLEGTAVLTAVSPSEQSQVSTLVDFDAASENTAHLTTAPGTSAEVGTDQLPQQAEQPRGGARVRGTAMMPSYRSSALVGGPLPEPTLGQVITHVTDCEVEAGNIQVFTSVRDVSNGILVGRFPTQYLGSGQFTTTIPTGQLTLSKTEDVCLAVESALGVVCAGVTAMGPGGATALCNALAIALDVVTVPSGEAAFLVAGCQRVAPAIELYCATLGASVTEGAPSLSEKICNAVFDNTLSPAQLEIQSCVVALPSSECSIPMTVAADGSFPVTLAVDLGNQSAIRDLTLDPESPGAGQSYVATVDIYCLVEGSTVHLSVVGTDGYSDSMSYPIASSQSEGMFTLEVPGAAEGVQDTVTVELVRPDGEKLTRTAFLVFG